MTKSLNRTGKRREEKRQYEGQVKVWGRIRIRIREKREERRETEEMMKEQYEQKNGGGGGRKGKESVLHKRTIRRIYRIRQNTRLFFHLPAIPCHYPLPRPREQGCVRASRYGRPYSLQTATECLIGQMDG
jgi:hypothetical protein